jgi:hypothetical protein
MAPGTFQVCVNLGGCLPYGFVLPTASNQHRHASALTQRVLLAMNTNRAFESLNCIAELWCAAHHPQTDPARATRDFQLILEHARRHNSLWPSLTLEYGKQERLGAFFRKTYASVGATEFKLSDYAFLLNGNVSFHGAHGLAVAPFHAATETIHIWSLTPLTILQRLYLYTEDFRQGRN